MMTPDPDPRTAPDDEIAEDIAIDRSGDAAGGSAGDAANRGVSAEDPAEGSDDEPDAGSAKG